MQLQGKAFLQMLAMFVRGLEDDDPAVDEAILHPADGTSGMALPSPTTTWWGRRCSGRSRTCSARGSRPDLRDAWTEAYRTLAATMRQASSSVL